MSVTGLDKILNNLKTIEKKMAKKLVRAAVNAGGEPLLKSFKANIPANLETLKLAADKQTTSKAGVAICRVGARKQYSKDRKTKQRKLSVAGKRFAKKAPGRSYPSRWFHLAEKGTKERVQKTTGKRTGRMPKTAMLGPAVDSTKGAVMTTMADKLRDGLASI